MGQFLNALFPGANVSPRPAKKYLPQSAPFIRCNFLTTPALPSYFDSNAGGANATRIDATGVIVAATSPRFDYDPVNIGQCLGLLVEEPRTNLLLNSDIVGTSLSTQTVTVTSGLAYTLSFYGSGSIDLTGAFTATLAGTGDFPNRVTLNFVTTTTSLTLTVTGQVKFAQLETGNDAVNSFATSFIPTAGAAVTRTAEKIAANGAAWQSRYAAMFRGTNKLTWAVEFDQLANPVNMPTATDGANCGLAVLSVDPSPGASRYYSFLLSKGVGSIVYFSQAFTGNNQNCPGPTGNGPGVVVNAAIGQNVLVANGNQASGRALVGLGYASGINSLSDIWRFPSYSLELCLGSFWSNFNGTYAGGALNGHLRKISGYGSYCNPSLLLPLAQNPA